MGNLGMPELMLIAVLALLLFGPKKLPEIGKQVGRALGEFKRASNELKRTIEEEIEKGQEPVHTTGPSPEPGPSPRPAVETVAASAPVTVTSVSPVPAAGVAPVASVVAASAVPAASTTGPEASIKTS